MESDGEDMRQPLQEPSTESPNNIVSEMSTQENMVIDTRLIPKNETNPQLLSIILPRETSQAPPNDSDEERLQWLIPGSRRVSTTQRRSTNLQQTQLQEQEEISDTASVSETYIENVADSHDYEFLSYHDVSPQAIDMAKDHQLPIDDENCISSPYNQVCMLSRSFTTKGSNELPLIHSHLINWGREGKPTLDWFENDEAIVEFLGVREGFPQGDHKAGSAIDLDRMTYFGEASASVTKDTDESDRNCKRKLDNLPIEQDSSTLLMEETEEINIAEGEVVHNIHLEKSLNQEEKDKFIQFFKQRLINFGWSYADMSGLDPELVFASFTIATKNQTI